MGKTEGGKAELTGAGKVATKGKTGGSSNWRYQDFFREEVIWRFLWVDLPLVNYWVSAFESALII